ncbi:MAG: trypsin-like peptidase domain-containing protein [Planctomycetes bacterium]|nr:trypsin-like peptidase domain-containing protein [Planctomycetota bacterium]
MHIRRTYSVSAPTAVLLLLALISSANAQIAPLRSYQAPVRIDTGWVPNLGDKLAVVFVTQINAKDAPWLRLAFDQAVLAGDPNLGTGSYLRITSVFDGAHQILDARTLAEWSQTSAYFNGDSVMLELFAYPDTGPNRLIMSELTAGLGDPLVWDTICGPTDDRILSNDPRNARLVPIGCTAWLYEDAAGCGNSFGTAGHCISNGTPNAVVQFNVPLSSSTGSIRHPPPSDQYSVQSTSIQSNGGGGTGNDYAIFRSFKNSITNLSPFDAQGDMYEIASTAANVQVNDPIRITGYGTTSPRNSWSQVQKTHVGPLNSATTGTRLRYRTDTSGGNSGSPVIDDNTGRVVGVHTHGGCTSSGGSNTGTAIQHTGWQNFLSNPRGTCFPIGIAFSYPNGLPILIEPAGGTVVRVNVDALGTRIPQPGTGMFHYDIGAGFVSVPMNQLKPNRYEAVFPAVICGEPIDYYFSALDTNGQLNTDPRDAPAGTHLSIAGTGTVLNTIASADFNAGLPAGWTASGLWNVSTACSVGPSCDGGSFAYFGNPANCNYVTGSRAVGSLTMPIISLPNVPVGGSLSLDFCYNLQTEANPVFDKATILVNGTQIDILDDSPGWTTHTIDLASYSGQFVVIEFKFDSGDTFANNFRGWQIDGVLLTAEVIDCNPCYADCDQSGTLDIFDFLCFQNSFVAGEPYACDCDPDPACDIFDFLCFQTAFVAGCP